MKDQFSQSEALALDFIADILKDYRGNLDMDSYAATVYEQSLWNFQNSLLRSYMIDDTEGQRFGHIDVPSHGYVIQNLV